MNLFTFREQEYAEKMRSVLRGNHATPLDFAATSPAGQSLLATVRFLTRPEIAHSAVEHGLKS